MKFEDKRFLIILGQPKAGTTSLFGWLASHPEVCASKFKETRFFLDPDYPLPRALAFNGNNLSEYSQVFGCCDKPLLMEASPDYLYCRTPLKIASLLPNAKAIVIIREPVQRLVSAYRFFQQRGLLPRAMTFDDYISAQRALKVTPETPVQYRALEHARLYRYLPGFQEVFGDRLLVVEFDAIKNNPRETLQSVCSFLGIDGSYFVNYRFAAENVTRQSRMPVVSNWFHRVRDRLAYKLLDHETARKLLRPISLLVQRLLVGAERPSSTAVSEETRSFINTFSQKT